MGLLKETKAAVDTQLYEGIGTHLIPRGFGLPLDRFMEGVIRYGRKIGFELPLIAPDNQYILTEPGIFDTDQIEVDREPKWIEPGAYITIGRRELHRVDDVSDTTIILSTSLRADQPEREYVNHYSNPIEVEGAYARGNTVINVDINRDAFIARGDVIAISPAASLNISFVEYTVLKSRFIGTTGAVSQYQVVLDRPIHRALTDGEVIQIVAYPAYKSGLLRVPRPVVTQLPIVGPYLVDWRSAPFVNGLSVDEYQTLQYYTPQATPIGSRRGIEKNHQVIHVPIRSDQLLFWDRAEGYGNYDADRNMFFAELSETGKWWWRYTCVPEIDVPTTNARGLIVTIPTARLQNNEQVRIPDDTDAVVFEYKVDGTYVVTPTQPAAGIIDVQSLPSDNDTVRIQDGFGGDVTFEFRSTAGFVATSGYRTVDVQGLTLTPEIAIALEQAIIAVRGAGVLGIEADAVANFVNLTNTVTSQNGNVPLAMTGSILGVWNLTGMSGGTDRVETVDISAVTTAIEVAQETASAVSRSGLEVEAIYPTIAPAVELISEVDGPGGNGPVTETVADPGYVVQGMTGGTGGIQWNFKVESDQDALLRVRLYPNNYQDTPLVAGVPQTISVRLDPTDADVERIDLIVSGTGPGRVYFGDWGIRGSRVAALQHTYVAHVFGEHNFASTGLMLKPIFQSLEDLRQQYDLGDDYDTGGMRV